MKLEGLRDEDLLFLVEIQSNQALQVLRERYNRKSFYIVKDMLDQFPDSGVSVDALLNICVESFEKALKKVDRILNSFSTYWRKISKHAMQEYLTKNSYTTSKVSPFMGVSIDSEVDLDEFDKVTICDVICDRNQENKDTEDLIFDEVIKYIKNDKFKMKINDKEVFITYMNGYEIPELEIAFPNYSKYKLYRVIRNGRKLLKGIFTNK